MLLLYKVRCRKSFHLELMCAIVGLVFLQFYVKTACTLNLTFSATACAAPGKILK